LPGLTNEALPPPPFAEITISPHPVVPSRRVCAVGSVFLFALRLYILFTSFFSSLFSGKDRILPFLPIVMDDFGFAPHNRRRCRSFRFVRFFPGLPPLFALHFVFRTACRISSPVFPHTPPMTGRKDDPPLLESPPFTILCPPLFPAFWVFSVSWVGIEELLLPP